MWISNKNNIRHHGLNYQEGSTSSLLYIFPWGKFPLPMRWAVGSSAVSHEDGTKCNYFDSKCHWTVWGHRVKPSGKHISRGSKWFLAAAPVMDLNHLCCVCAVLWLRVKSGTSAASADMWDDVKQHKLSHYVSAHFRGKVSGRNCVWWQRVQELPPQDEDS